MRVADGPAAIFGGDSRRARRLGCRAATWAWVARSPSSPAAGVPLCRDERGFVAPLKERSDVFVGAVPVQRLGDGRRLRLGLERGILSAVCLSAAFSSVRSGHGPPGTRRGRTGRGPSCGPSYSAPGGLASTSIWMTRAAAERGGETDGVEDAGESRVGALQAPRSRTRTSTS